MLHKKSEFVFRVKPPPLGQFYNNLIMYLERAPPTLEKIHFTITPNVKPKVLALLPKIPNLKALFLCLEGCPSEDDDLNHLEDPHFDKKGLFHLFQLKNLQTLDLYKSSLSASDSVIFRQEIKKLENLTHLSLKSCNFGGDDVLTAVGTLTRLSFLDLRACFFTDIGLRSVLQLTTLSTLHLSRTNGITDEGLTDLRKLTDLTRLSLHYCWGLTAAGIINVRPLTKLVDLNLWAYPGIKDEHIKDLSHLTNLTAYSLGCLDITKACIPFLSNLIKITDLRLTYCEKVCDNFGILAARLENLSSLSVGDCGITARFIEALVSGKYKPSRLTSLDLASCSRLSEIAFLEIGKLTALKSLSFGRMAAPLNPGIRHLSDLLQLETIFISGKDLQNEGLEKLLCRFGEFGKLRHLSLRSVQYLSESEWIASLKQKFPNVTMEL